MNGMKPKVEIYSNGPVSCSVCAAPDLSREEVEVEVNAHNPTGISSSWHISDEDKFSGGEPHPRPCPEHPERTHYLLHC